MVAKTTLTEEEQAEMRQVCLTCSLPECMDGKSVCAYKQLYKAKVLRQTIQHYTGKPLPSQHESGWAEFFKKVYAYEA